MNSEQLLPDENIPELLKEANFSFLDLNSFEVCFFLLRANLSADALGRLRPCTWRPATLVVR